MLLGPEQHKFTTTLPKKEEYYIFVIFLVGDLPICPSLYFYTVDREAPWQMFQCSVLRTSERHPGCLGREQRLNQASFFAGSFFYFVGADSLELVAVDLLRRRSITQSLL